MTIHAKLFHGAAALVAAATAVTLGAAVGLGSSGGEPSPTTPARPDAMAQVNPWATGDAAMARCDLVPEHYVVHDETVRSGGTGESVNVWAAGDAAVARYFNELARLCANTRR
jgi:hypothetical protein